MNAFNSYLKFMSRLLGRTPSASVIFKTPEGETIFRSAYESALRLWPVPHESVFVFSRFGNTHVIVSGNPQGKPLILLHGALAGATMWFPQADVLSRNNRLYAVDILGDVNLSVPIYLPKNRVETTEWLTAVFDELGIEQATVMGISLGGFLALDLALSAPQRVNRIVVLDPAASLAPYSLSFMFRTIPNILAGFFSEHPMDSIVKWATASGQIIEEAIPILRQMDCAIKYGQMSLRTLPGLFQDNELQQLQIPMLLLMGTKAVMYDSQVAAQRAQHLIRNVIAEFIPDTGHLLTFEKPELVNEQVRRFLDSSGAE